MEEVMVQRAKCDLNFVNQGVAQGEQLCNNSLSQLCVDIRNLEAHLEDLTERNRQQMDDSVQIDHCGTKIVLKFIRDVAEESSSALVLPMDANLRLSCLPDEFSLVKREAGEELKKFCNDYIEEYGSLKMGDAVVLPSGDLKFDKVIAAYCPDHDEEIGDERSIYFLKEAIERVLDLSSLYQFNSIMIPSFCTSKAKFPVDLYAKVVIKVISYHNSRLSRIILKIMEICKKKQSLFVRT